MNLLVEEGFEDVINYDMRRSLGFLITLWGISQFFSSSFSALDGAARESFQLIETSATISQEKMLKHQ